MRFAQICEAHDVLSNGKFDCLAYIKRRFSCGGFAKFLVQNKAIYDNYGEYGLKEGCVTPEGQKIGGGYFLKSDPEGYFEKVLSKTEFLLEPRAVNGSDAQQSIFADSFGGHNQPKAGKPENVEVTLDCSLEELYNGAVKQFEYSRNIVQHDAKSIKPKTESMQVEVKPGFSESTELVFKKMGH